MELTKDPSFNVLGTPLQPCSLSPQTGWFRDGCCNTNEDDHGSHTICCRVTTEFLSFLRAKGNDLMTPAPEHGFRGLRGGDQWCVCAASWKQAYEASVACPVMLESTHRRALELVSLDLLLEMAIAPEA